VKSFITVCCIILSLNASMSIQEAWHIIELKSDSVKADTNDVKRAELKAKAAKSMYLPSISLTGSYTHLSEPINLDTSDLSNILSNLHIPFPTQLDLSKQDVFLADLNLLWPLYTGGKIDAAQDIYAAQVSEAKVKKEMKKDIEFLKLIKYYYGVVLSQSLLSTTMQAQKALKLHYENAKKLKQEGQIANIELLNAEVKLDSAKIDTTKARHSLQIAYSALSSITKSKDTPSSKLFVNEEIKSEEYYKDTSKDNYSALKILDIKSRQSDSLISIKEAAWKPKVMAYANYNLYRDDSPLMDTLPRWFGGVILKIDLLKRDDRSQEIQVAKLLNTKLKHIKAQAIEDLKLLVEKTYKGMLSDYEEFNALNSSLKLAQENYRLREIAFKEGLSTSVELVDAQMFLMGARTKRLNAAYNFVQKVAQLCVLSGDREMFFDIAYNSQEINHAK
jgi:outer membrane protein TolC